MFTFSFLSAANWLLLSKALFRTLMRGTVRDELIDEVGVMKDEDRLSWPWAPGMWYLNNDKTLVIRYLWVGKKLFTASLAISSECGNMEELISHAFFHCFLRAIWFAYWMESSLSWQCSTVAEQDGTLSLWLLVIMRIMIWTTRQKEFHEHEPFSFQTLVAFYK